MRNKIVFVLLIAAVALTAHAFCMAETTTSMSPTPAPSLKQIIGNADAFLAPTRYPSFYEGSSDNPTCDSYLKTQCTDAECLDPLNNGIGDGSANSGLSLAPLWLKSTGTTTPQPAVSSRVDYALIPELAVTDFVLPDKYKSTSKLLVTWTVRIEGYAVAAYNPTTALCEPWHGTSWQRFAEGQVYTRLYVNGKAMGTIAALTIPSAGTASAVTEAPEEEAAPTQPTQQWWRKLDPTLVGSYLLTKEDFGGSFPAKMNVEIRWYNDTSLKIKTPAKMRSLNITTVPIAAQN